jgi:hypothetical protein
MGVHVVTFINICMVFFISGLTLRTDELKQAFRRTAATGEEQQTLAAGSSVLTLCCGRSAVLHHTDCEA